MFVGDFIYGCERGCVCGSFAVQCAVAYAVACACVVVYDCVRVRLCMVA